MVAPHIPIILHRHVKEIVHPKKVEKVSPKRTTMVHMGTLGEVIMARPSGIRGLPMTTTRRTKNSN